MLQTKQAQIKLVKSAEAHNGSKNLSQIALSTICTESFFDPFIARNAFILRVFLIFRSSLKSTETPQLKADSIGLVEA